MSQMDIKDLDFQELLPNQGLEIVGGAQQLLEDTVNLEAVFLSTNVPIDTKILVLDSCGSCMGHPPLPVPQPPPIMPLPQLYSISKVIHFKQLAI